MNEVIAYLALGSNLGDRRGNLESAFSLLGQRGVETLEVSPVFRTPALTLPGSPPDWNRPYLNCAAQVRTTLSPMELLKTLKEVEAALDRDFSARWAPRPMDIDILFYGNERVSTESLTIPHPGLGRYFVADALSWLGEREPRYGGLHLPVFMGILNITPDSFSDGGAHDTPERFAATFERFERELVGIIDIGAESTRPGAAPLDSAAELRRLEPVFRYLKAHRFPRLRPRLSIDTYHFETAAAALEQGFDIINDVNALKDEGMLDLLAAAPQAQYVLTHSLSVPPRADTVLSGDPVSALERFLEDKLALLDRRGISPRRVFFDIGLGFGKDPYSSFTILNGLEKLHGYGVRLLVGHSRKSFLKGLEENEPTRDADTLALSLAIAPMVDVLRVHSPVEQQNALLAYRMIE